MDKSKPTGVPETPDPRDPGDPRDPQDPQDPRDPGDSVHAAMQREFADPDERVRPLPWFFIMFLGAMGMWGAFYIVSTPSGELSSFGDQRTVATLRPAVVAPGVVVVDGKQIYGAKCAACHQATGVGVAGVFPPLAGAEWVLGDERVLASILLHGVNGELVVKGNTYKGAMPAFGTLADEDIAAVLTYIRSDWGNSAKPVTAATVKAQREATKDQTAPYAGGQALKALGG